MFTEPLEVDPAVTCTAYVPIEGGDAGEAEECGAPSRFVVECSDGDKSYGSGGGTEESCEAHLAETVAGMVAGDVNVHAIVTIRWEPPEGMPRSCPSCGSEVRAERGYVPGFTGMPVTCNDDWHEGED